MDKSIVGQGDFSIVPIMGGQWEYSHMPDTKEILRQRLRQLLDSAEITPYALSKAIGANPGYIRDILDPEKSSMPSAERLDRIAKILNTTTDYLMGKSAIPDQVRSEVTLSDVRREWRGLAPEEPGIALVGTGDCADLEVQTEEGAIHIERSSFDPEHPVTYIARPPALQGDREAYAIYFHGASMEPRFFAGEIGIVQPTRPAGPGDFVLVQLTNGHDTDVISVLVKRLVRQNSREVVLEQFNPPLVFTLQRRQVARIHRIVPPTELLYR